MNAHERLDIIGDIHGCADSLRRLLLKLGYELRDGVYAHPDRTAVFLGDFIDRGPSQREVIGIVRPMIESGSARAVMGNHEFNAIAYATPDPKNRDQYLRPRNEKNTQQHEAFLKAYPAGSNEYQEVIDWFKTLPLWLDLGGIRIIHACWDQGAIDRISRLVGGNRLNDALVEAASRKGESAFEDVETVLKGKEIPLPDGAEFHDKDGHPRQHIRIRWWEPAGTYRSAFLGPESAVAHIPDDEIHGDHLIEYAHDAPPVVLGHYWQEDKPKLFASNIACVDYSVAKPGGKLVAYRWDGEQTLSDAKFVWVPTELSDAE